MASRVVKVYVVAGEVPVAQTGCTLTEYCVPGSKPVSAMGEAVPVTVCGVPVPVAVEYVTV